MTVLNIGGLVNLEIRDVIKIAVTGCQTVNAIFFHCRQDDNAGAERLGSHQSVGYFVNNLEACDPENLLREGQRPSKFRH